MLWILCYRGAETCMSSSGFHAQRGRHTCGVSQMMPSVKTRGRRSSFLAAPLLPPAPAPLASLPAARDSIISSSSAARSISSKLQA